MILGTLSGNLFENVQKNILHNVLNLDKIENFGNIEKPKKKLGHFWGKYLEIQSINEKSTWRV
jgi:phosphatidylinositol kinase/protein kinase (PI-3  family)